MARVIGILSIVAVLFALWGLVREIRRPRPLRPLWGLVGVIAPLVMLAVNLVFLRQARPDLFGPAMGLVGIGFGITWGQSARLGTAGVTVIVHRSTLHLVFWGVSYAVTQVLTTWASARWVGGGLLAMFFAAGTSLGSSGDLLWRGHRLRRELAARSQWSSVMDAQAAP